MLGSTPGKGPCMATAHSQAFRAREHNGIPTKVLKFEGGRKISAFSIVAQVWRKHSIGVCTRTKVPSRFPMIQRWTREKKGDLSHQPEQQEVATAPESPAMSAEATEEHRG